MIIRLQIRFSIPSSLLINELKRELSNVGFVVEEITPTAPSGKEVMAYVVTGLFHGEWQDLFVAWRSASLEAAIQEVLLKEE